MYFSIDVNYENCVYEWISEYLFMTFMWISYEMNEWEMGVYLRNIEILLIKWSLGLIENFGSVFHKFRKTVLSIFSWHSAGFSIKLVEPQINYNFNKWLK